MEIGFYFNQIKTLYHLSCSRLIMRISISINPKLYIMNDKLYFIIDCTSLIPVIAIILLLQIANDHFIQLIVSYVLCGELLFVLIGRFLKLYYIDIVFVWLSGILLWLWYLFIY